jgi:GntR family transcriptional regulator/MocR family aminotransferase
LPSSRELAQELGFNRKTVVTAYEELVAQGWLEAAGRKGTAVATSLPRSRPGAAAKAPEASPPIGRRPIYRFVPSPERPIAVPPGRVIKLDEGSPDGSLFPPEPLARAFRTAALCRAAPATGLSRSLRQRQAARQPGHDAARGARAGGGCGKHLRHARQPDGHCAGRAPARPPGAVALAEALTYEPAVAAFQAAGVPVLPVPLDDEGIDVDAVERACRSRKVCAVFLTPHHQFPSTVSLAPERRLRLVELARQFGFAIIEDDYDHEFRFGSQPLLPMAAYAPDVVIYVGSLSKLLLPALRVGYRRPAPVIAAAAHQVSILDGMGNSLTEDAVALLFEEGEVRRHARKATRIYGERRDALARAVQAELGAMVSARLPAGGLAMWLEFQDLAALARIEAGAAAAGITFAQSASYRLSPEAPHGLRLGFASHPADRTVQAVRVLGQLGRG